MFLFIEHPHFLSKPFNHLTLQQITIFPIKARLFLQHIHMYNELSVYSCCVMMFVCHVTHYINTALVVLMHCEL